MKGIEKIEEWYKSEPDKLVSYAYYLKGQIPPKDGKQEVFRELNKKYPCPEKYKANWV